MARIIDNERDNVRDATSGTSDTQQPTVQSESLLNADGTLDDSTSGDLYARYRDNVSKRGSARMALADMMRPEDTSKRERSLRRLALGQALGEIIGGLFGFGVAQKNNSAVVVPESQATKTQKRLLKLQEQGLTDRDAYRQLLAKIRMKNIDDESEAEKLWTKGALDQERRDKEYASKLELLAKKQQLQEQRDAKKDSQWNQMHEERKRHNKAMEGAKRGDSTKGNSQSGYGALLRPSEKVITKTKDTGDILGGKKTETYTQRLPNMTKEERIKWNAIADNIITAMNYQDATPYEIAGLLAPLQRLLSGSINESVISDLIYQYPQSYDVLTYIARNNIQIDDEDISAIRTEFEDKQEPIDIINNIKAIKTANQK